MYYYKHFIEQWKKDTFRYSYAEMGILLILRDIYYDQETGIPASQIDRLIRPQTDEETAALQRVLSDHFELMQPDDDRAAQLGLSEACYVCGSIEDEIAAYRVRGKINQENGARGGRPQGTGSRQRHAKSKPEDNRTETHSVLCENPTETHSVSIGNRTETLTNNYELRTNSEDKSSGVAAAAEPPPPPDLLDLDRRCEDPIPDAPPRSAVIPLRPSADDRAILWKRGLMIVRELTGSPDKRARPLLGKWLKTLSDDSVALNQILATALEKRPGDPISWIEAAIRARCARKPGAWPDAGDREGWVEWVERGGEPRARVGTGHDGNPQAEISGTFLDWYTGELCDAAGGLPVRGIDWRAAMDWLADGLDAYDDILPAIRRAARTTPATITSISFFDKAVRATRRPAPAAA